MARDRTHKQRLADFAANVVLRLLIGLALMLPYRMRIPMMATLTRNVIAPLAGYRARARENLARIMPELSQADRRRIADEACANAGRTLIENYSSRDLMARMKNSGITGAGVLALEKAHRDGQPVILVTGHFGNYEAGRAALVARGYTIGGLYRPMRNAFFNEHYVRTMQAFGGPIFAQGARGTAGFVRHLKAGGQLVLLFDQNVIGGARLDFMGHEAATATSAADLALRYGALLIPFYATRRPDGLSFDIEFEAPIPPTDGLTMTQCLNDSLSARIRNNPGQWFWIHRRWK